MAQFELIKSVNARKNDQQRDPRAAEINILRNKGFLLLTEKERKRYNELLQMIENKAT